MIGGGTGASRLTARMLLLLFVLGCAKNAPPATDGVAALPPPMVLGEAGPNGDPTFLPPGADDAALEACRQRVEGASTAGECKTDADCARAGCSQEVCVTRLAAATLNTTCEKLACFTQLDRCGCVSGICSWSWRKP